MDWWIDGFMDWGIGERTPRAFGAGTGVPFSVIFVFAGLTFRLVQRTIRESNEYREIALRGVHVTASCRDTGMASEASFILCSVCGHGGLLCGGVPREGRVLG